MEDHTFRTVCRIVGDVTGTSPEELTGKTRFSDLDLDEDEFHDIYERCCDELDVPLAGILNSMPIYRQRVGDLTMNSWRNLAPFHPKAARLLEAHDVRMECETISSLAETMRQGRYVSSGEYWPSDNAPRSKRYVLGWFAGLFGAAVALPFALTLLPCNPLCSDCSLSTLAQMKDMLPVSLGIALFIQAIAVVPGVIGIYNNPKPPLRSRRESGHLAQDGVPSGEELADNPIG